MNNIRSIAASKGAPPMPSSYKTACANLDYVWRTTGLNKQQFMHEHPDVFWALSHFATWRSLGAGQ